METILDDVKTMVKEEKGLNKEAKEERILELYKERTFQHLKDYKVKMFEIEKIGYDATGKKMDGNELSEVAKKIQDFIIEEGL
ncbi:hypothetical protein EZS27_043384 [termite gut metagenome]|uniref:Uncharacterized protein n=1 Tax=termite gut metagenome TaxID=433724 RepID=A0A5J4P6D3_9ZZZZ